MLRTAAEPVTDFDKQLRTLVKDLTQTLDDAQGAGLAAPQIGVGLRVFAYAVGQRARPSGQPGARASPTRRSRTGRRGACPSRASTTT